MIEKVFKLDFQNNRVHFGEAAESVGLESGAAYILADTLFSAICNSWVMLYGVESLEALLSEFEEAENIPFFISDCMPVCPEGLLFSKPVCSFSKTEQKQNSNSREKKKLKSIKFLKANQIKTFLNGSFRPDEGIDFDKYMAFDEIAQVKVSRTQDSEPFSVKYLRFADKSGLWFLAKFKDEKIYNQFKEVLKFTGKVIGIGGKKSSGAGKFELKEDDSELKNIKQYLNISDINTTKDPALCLSICNPKDQEESRIIQKSFYQIVNRRGFHYSQDSAWPAFVKKKPVGMILAGSLLIKNIKGRLIDVTPELENGKKPPHKLYRYGFAFLAEVK